MELTEIQIEGIRNLDCIFVYSIEEVFNSKQDNRYVGVRVLYTVNGEKKVLALDYKNKFFPDFLRKIVERYNEEKNNRNIILFGPLAEKLVGEKSSTFVKKPEEGFKADTKIPFLNTKKEEIKYFKPYLEETIKQILYFYKKYENIEILSIDGYNNKYICEYKVGNVVKTFPLSLSLYKNELNFKIGRADNKSLNITGTIANEDSLVEINWNSNNDKIKGNIKFNVSKQETLKNIKDFIIDLKNDTSSETLTESDLELILFYKELLNIDFPQNILKINDKSFAMGEENKISEEENTVYYNSLGANLDVTPKEVTITLSEKNYLNKFNSMLTTLEKVVIEIKLIELEISGEKGILIQRKYSNGVEELYKYEYLKVEDYKDLSQQFNVTEHIEFDEQLNSLAEVKEKIKTRKEI